MEHKRFILWKKVLAMFMIVAILFSYMPVNAVYGYIEEINTIVAGSEEEVYPEENEILIEEQVNVETDNVVEENTINVPTENNADSDINQYDSNAKENNNAQETETNITENENKNIIIENVVEPESTSNIVVENEINSNTNSIITLDNSITNNTIIDNNTNIIENVVDTNKVENENIEEDKLELITLTGACTWKDNNNTYNTRPKSVTINLLKNNELVLSKDIKPDAEGKWTYVFENLEKYDEKGKEINYTVTENDISEYEIISENENKTNVLKGKTEIAGTVKWDDNNNENGLRPENVNIELYKENEEIPIETTVISEDEIGNWEFLFSEQEKYDENGIKINYTVLQTEIDEYETIVDIVDGKVSITNKQNTKLELTWQEILEYGPYASALVKYAEENGEKVSSEEQYLYEKYKELVYGKGAELAATALILGTEAFTEEELAVYNAYQKIILNNGEEYPIKTLDIEADGDYKSSEILSVRRSEDGLTLRYLQYDGEVIRNSIKYVATTDGADPKKGDQAAYCMNYDRDYAEDAKYITDAWNQMMEQKKYKDYEPFFSKLYSELSYVVSIGCKEYGKHSTSQYSTKNFIKNYSGYSSSDAKWEEDYYATQTVIYVILNDYITNFNDILKSMNITVKDENAKNEIYNKLKEMYSGHPLDNKLKENGNDTNSSYNSAHQSAVLDAVKAMYNEALKQREIINNIDADGYDSSIVISPGTQTLKYENGNWIAKITVNTTGTKVGSVHFSGPSGMKTSYDKSSKTYTITIPANDIKDVNKIQISANAQFKANKTVTYICNDSDNQNIAFYQDTSDETISKTATATLNKSETVTINGSKTWVDNNNTYGTRPTSITVNLLADGVVVESKTVTEVDGWRWSFTGHAKYNSNNKQIEYKITENKVTGYNSTIVNKKDVVNTLSGTTEISGTKTWIDNEDSYGTRPASIRVNLYQNGIYKTYQDVTKDMNWTYKFSSLPKYDENGKLYEYTISENPVTGYETIIDENNNITNKLTGKTEISGVKTWVDNGNLYETRPDSIIVNLFRNDDSKPLKTLTVEPDATGNWTYKFDELEKYDETGKLYEYAISENPVTNYETIIDENNNITNKLTGKTEISGVKTWIDNFNAYETRPDSIVVNLFRNEEIEPLETLIVEPDLLGNWFYVFDELEKYDEEGKLYTYTITEDSVEKYETTIEPVEGSLTEINITNKLTDETEIKGNKSWIDNNNAYGTRPKSINLILLANGEKVAEKEVIADEDGNWNFAFTNLFKYDDNGVKIKYTIEENAVLGYVTDIEVVSETETNITNKLTGETEIGGTKLWKDNNNAYGTRPDSIIVNLLANGEKIAEEVVTENEKGNWDFAFTKLLKYDENGVKIKYTIEENAVLGYITDIENVDENKTNLINTLTGKTEVKGFKIWEDYNNAYVTRPDSIIVNLLANGEKITEKQVTSSGEEKWEFIFGELEEYDKNGVKIEYAIAENPVLGYTTTIVGTNIINRVNEKEQASENLDLTPTTGKKNWLKHFIVTAITSLFGMIFARKRKLLGEGK